MSDLRNPPYDACLYGITTFQCNLDCNYCISEFVRNLVMCDEPSELHIKTNNINISALKNTLNNSNKIYRIDFTGGEPFLVPNMVELCIELTKKHFIGLTTNLTSKKEFAVKINPKRVIFIVA